MTWSHLQPGDQIQALPVFCRSSTTELRPQPRNFCSVVKWIIHAVVKVNCQLYSEKLSLCHYTFPFKLFLGLGCRFLTCKLKPLKKIFLKEVIKNYEFQFAQHFCCTLYLVYNKEFPLVYALGLLICSDSVSISPQRGSHSH